jgi:hypothetical protein
MTDGWRLNCRRFRILFTLREKELVLQQLTNTPTTVVVCVKLKSQSNGRLKQAVDR